jgi:hypothetical protein
MHLTSRNFFVMLAFCAAFWLAVGNAVKVMVASGLNQTIDIVICTGAGMKKVSMPVEQGASGPMVMKHCGNGALVALFPMPVHPLQLSFAKPGTVASWQFAQTLGVELLRTWENAPPPSRGPPAALV